MFDWRHFLDDNGLSYTERGHGAGGQVGMQCPFCGSGSTIAMSVSLAGKGWHCWRDASHRGRSPVRLIEALLKCTRARAMEIAGETRTPMPTDPLAYAAQLMGIGAAPAPRADCPVMPDGFRSFNDRRVSGRPYWSYMKFKRKFTDAQIADMDERFGLRYGVDGPYRGRVIIPITFEGQLVTWTGRAISDAVELRYKTLSYDADVAQREGLIPALGPINDYIYAYDYLTTVDADTILLTEGPFDALKTIMLGERDGIVATCFFTMQPTPAQIGLLNTLLPRFRRRALLLDVGTFAKSLRVQAELNMVDVTALELREAKDPGEMTYQQLMRVTSKLKRVA